MVEGQNAEETAAYLATIQTARTQVYRVRFASNCVMTSTGVRSEAEVSMPAASGSCTRLALGIVILGAVVRVTNYVTRGGLWTDEAMLLRNVAERGYRELLEPLAYNQAASVGFLIMQKAAADAIGYGRFGTRLVPLLFGLAALPLFMMLGRRSLPRREASMVLILFALTPQLVYYSAEAKQYAVDVVATLVVLVFAMDVLLYGARIGRLAAGAIAGVFLVWLSHSVVLVMAGIGLTLLAMFLVRGQIRAALGIALVGACWLGSFAVHWVVSLADLSSHDTLAEAWQHAAFPLIPKSIKELQWWFVGPLEPFRILADAPHGMVTIIGHVGAGIFLLLVVLGCAGLRRRSRWMLALLLSPLAVTLVVSAATGYPIHGRFILWMIPIMLLLTGEGLVILGDASGTNVQLRRPLFVIVLLILLLSLAEWQGRWLSCDRLESCIRKIVATAEAGDVFYVDRLANQPFIYYTRHVPGFAFARPIEMVETKAGMPEVSRYRDVYPLLQRRERVWLVLTKRIPSRSFWRQREMLLALFDGAFGKPVQTVGEPPSAFLYKPLAHLQSGADLAGSDG